MKGTVVLAILSLLGHASSQDSGADPLSRQKRDQPFLTTPAATTDIPSPSTTISLSPQTSISVHHTIVRNKPAYPYPYTETTLQPEGTEDTSYYYTYEDVSEDASKHITSTITPMTTLSTIKPTVKSFWNSQKALLDARRKENSQKFLPTYSKPANVPKENKPTIEFKVREKPKFGLANKNKYMATTTKRPEMTTTTTTTTTKPIELSTSSKVVKSDTKLNLPIQNLSEKDLLKTLKNINLVPNQIVGRVGDIPVQNNLNTAMRAQSTNINNFRPSKFDNTLRNVQFVDNAKTQQQPTLAAQNQPSLPSNFNAAALLNSLKTLNLNQQRSAALNLNQQTSTNSQPLLNLNQNQQAIQNLLTQNQKPLLNLNQNQQPLLNLNQQPRNNLNQAPASTFITASAPLGSAGRTGDISIQAPSSLLQRLGAMVANGGNANNVVGRDGGGSYGGGGNGISLNLGSVADPLTFILRLISLIPRPLLDLNGRIFFGIELGKNAGIVSGAGAGGTKNYNG